MFHSANRIRILAVAWAAVICISTRSDRTVFTELPVQLLTAIAPQHRWVHIWTPYAVFTSKVYHVVEFALLCTLVFLALIRLIKKPSRALVAAAAISALYAVGDEWHQTYIPSRHGSWVDFAIDCLGIALASACIWWRLKHQARLARVIDSKTEIEQNEIEQNR